MKIDSTDDFSTRNHNHLEAIQMLFRHEIDLNGLAAICDEFKRVYGTHGWGTTAIKLREYAKTKKQREPQTDDEILMATFLEEV